MFQNHIAYISFPSQYKEFEYIVVVVAVVVVWQQQHQQNNNVIELFRLSALD